MSIVAAELWLRLFGFNRHDLVASPVLSHEELVRDIQLLRDVGANFVRGAAWHEVHTPPSPPANTNFTQGMHRRLRYDGFKAEALCFPHNTTGNRNNWLDPKLQSPKLSGTC